MFAKGLERRYGGLHHGDVAGAKDLVEDLEDAWRYERQVLGRLLD